MTVRVKYCGGCNPRYDRAGLVRRIWEDFPRASVVYDETPSGEEIDVVLVVCGCPVRCASHGELRGLSGKWIVSSPDEYPLLYEKLKDVENTGQRSRHGK